MTDRRTPELKDLRAACHLTMVALSMVARPPDLRAVAPRCLLPEVLVLVRSLALLLVVHVASRALNEQLHLTHLPSPLAPAVILLAILAVVHKG